MLLEGIIPDNENPLLRKLLSGKYMHANDPDREVGAARYFAEEINEMRLSSENAFHEYLSKLAIPADFHELHPFFMHGVKPAVSFPTRIISNQSSKIILHLGEQLYEDRFYELIETVTKDYFNNREIHNDSPLYLDELILAGKLLGKRRLNEKRVIVDKICHDLLSYLKRDTESRSCAEALGASGNITIVKDLLQFIEFCHMITYPVPKNDKEDNYFILWGNAVLALKELSKIDKEGVKLQLKEYCTNIGDDKSRIDDLHAALFRAIEY